MSGITNEGLPESFDETFRGLEPREMIGCPQHISPGLAG